MVETTKKGGKDSGVDCLGLKPDVWASLGKLVHLSVLQFPVSKAVRIG